MRRNCRTDDTSPSTKHGRSCHTLPVFSLFRRCHPTAAIPGRKLSESGVENLSRCSCVPPITTIRSVESAKLCPSSTAIGSHEGSSIICPTGRLTTSPVSAIWPIWCSPSNALPPTLLLRHLSSAHKSSRFHRIHRYRYVLIFSCLATLLYRTNDHITGVQGPSISTSCMAKRQRQFAG